MTPRGQQARALARYLQREVRAYSAFYRPVLERAFRERDGRSGIDLGTLPLTALSDVEEPTSVVLRPEYSTISRLGAPSLYAKVLWARAMGRVSSLNRTLIDPTYKPIHWTSEEGFLVGSSSVDLDRLAELGRRWLEQAGIVPTDVVVSLVDPAPTLGFWELALGTRRAGLTAMLLPASAPGGEVAGLGPSVLAGSVEHLSRVITEAGPDALTGVGLVLVVGEPPDRLARAALQDALGRDEVDVLFAWAPAGVRSLWTECPGQSGLHTSPDAEVVEVVGDEIVWTALGWYGTVLVRLQTGVTAALTSRSCPGCGRTSPRVLPEGLQVAGVAAQTPTKGSQEQSWRRAEGAGPASRRQRGLEGGPGPEPGRPSPPTAPARRVPAFARVLDEHPGVVGWQAELRIVDGHEELLVFLATTDGNLAAVLHDLVRSMQVTQFVVLPPDELAWRLEVLNGERILDLRP